MYVFALFLLPVLAFAADAAPTAGQIVADLNLIGLAKYAAAMVVGALLSPAAQAWIEHLLAPLIPSYLGFLKSLLPTALAFVLAKLAIWLGIDPTQAYMSAVTMAGGAHVVNGLPIAADNTPLPPPIPGDTTNNG